MQKKLEDMVMKVEQGNILLDDEIVVLDNVTLIDVVKQGSPFDKPEFCLNIKYIDGSSKVVDMTSDPNKMRVFYMLSRLGDKIINEGNHNFGNIGIALINMDYVDEIKYDESTEHIILDITNNQNSTFKATRAQATRVLTRAQDAYRYYSYINKQQL